MLVKIETVYPLTEPGIEVSFKDVDISVRHMVTLDYSSELLRNMEQRIMQSVVRGIYV